MPSLSTPESVALKAQIKEMWERDMSSGQICAALGKSRGCIMGHIDRMKLQPRTKLHFTARVNRPRQSPKPIIPPAEIIEPESLNLDLMQVNDRTCRWPHGDGPFTFCGQMPHPGSYYCEPHMRRAGQPKHPATQKIEAPCG